MDKPVKAQYKESRTRSILKGISWRLIGSLDTYIIATLTTKAHESNSEKALGLVVTEVVTKYLLYYGHERLWLHIMKERTKTHLTSVLKAISWRAVGTVDTMILAWLWFGNPMTGLKIASIELVTKIILYYLHERVWAVIPQGVIRDRFAKVEDVVGRPSEKPKNKH